MVEVVEACEILLVLACFGWQKHFGMTHSDKHITWKWTPPVRKGK